LEIIVRRVLVPNWHQADSGFNLPGYDPWEYPTRWLHRVLASPSGGEPLPALPTAGDRHEQGIGYWTCLAYLLRYSLGWTDPGLGLKWWYRNGKPTDGDVRLGLLSEIWDRDGQLELFLAQVGANPHEDAQAAKRWLAAQREIAAAASWPPFGGGSDPLHLAGHRFPEWPDAAESTTALLRTDKQTRSAVLIMDTYVSWYRLLDSAADQLPLIGDRSWHVDVVVRPVGWLGTYRRSRVTGRWFSGPHHLHTRGSTES
jgi:hypothetical protein